MIELALVIGLDSVLTNLGLDLDANIPLGLLVIESRRFGQRRFLRFPLLLFSLLDASLI